jgi:hypothetical protein
MLCSSSYVDWREELLSRRDPLKDYFLIYWKESKNITSNDLRKISRELKQIGHCPSVLAMHLAWKLWSQGIIQTSWLSHLLVSLDLQLSHF